MVISSEEEGTCKWCGLVGISHGQRNVVMLRQVVVPLYVSIVNVTFSKDNARVHM